MAGADQPAQPALAADAPAISEIMPEVGEPAPADSGSLGVLDTFISAQQPEAVEAEESVRATPAPEMPPDQPPSETQTPAEPMPDISALMEPQTSDAGQEISAALDDLNIASSGTQANSPAEPSVAASVEAEQSQTAPDSSTDQAAASGEVSATDLLGDFGNLIASEPEATAVGQEEARSGSGTAEQEEPSGGFEDFAAGLGDLNVAQRGEEDENEGKPADSSSDRGSTMEENTEEATDFESLFNADTTIKNVH